MPSGSRSGISHAPEQYIRATLLAGANYATSWEHQQVTDAEWRILRDGLADEVRAWRAAWQEPREWDDVTMNNALSSAAHLAYHVGAIRQIDQAASGLSAREWRELMAVLGR